MRPDGRLFGLQPQVFVKGHVETMAGLAVEERPRRDRDPEHLLQADRLGTELHLVAVVRFGLPPLILHGEGVPDITVRLMMKFDHIGNAHNAQAQGTDEDASAYTYIASRLLSKLMDPFVKNSPFHSQTIFIPHLFDKHQGALPGTKNHVLQ